MKNKYTCCCGASFEAESNTVDSLVGRIRKLLIAWREDADAQGQDFYGPDGLIKQTRKDVRSECVDALRNALGNYFLECAGIASDVESEWEEI